MRKIITVIFLVASLPLGVKAEPLSPADIKGLLERIREKRAAAPSMQADFQEQRKVHLLDEPINSSGKIWFQAPNKFRVERKGNAPSITVSDGQQLWIYYPNFRSAEHYTIGRRSPLDSVIAGINTALNLENVESNFNITARKIDKGYEFELVPRSASMKRMFQTLNLRINEELLVERTEMV